MSQYYFKELGASLTIFKFFVMCQEWLKQFFCSFVKYFVQTVSPFFTASNNSCKMNFNINMMRLSNSDSAAALI